MTVTVVLSSKRAVRSARRPGADVSLRSVAGGNGEKRTSRLFDGYDSSSNGRWKTVHPLGGLGVHTPSAGWFLESAGCSFGASSHTDKGHRLSNARVPPFAVRQAP